MSDLFLLSPAQMSKTEPFFPRSHGAPRVDDRRVISSIVYVLKHGLQWRDAPRGYGPHKTLYNRFWRWTTKGVFDRIFNHLAADDGPPGTLMTDATHLKAHRTACSLLKVASSPPYGAHQRVGGVIKRDERFTRQRTPSCTRSATAKAGRSQCV